MESALLADSRYGRATAIAGELYSSGRRSAGVSSGSLTSSIRTLQSQVKGPRVARPSCTTHAPPVPLPLSLTHSVPRCRTPAALHCTLRDELFNLLYSHYIPIPLPRLLCSYLLVLSPYLLLSSPLVPT